LTDARAAPVRDQVAAQYLKHHRTAASGMAGLGTAPHVIEAVLNHRSGVIRGVAVTYNRFNYAAEKRAALDLWTAHVAALPAPF
jgi:hypothetical protein